MHYEIEMDLGRPGAPFHTPRVMSDDGSENPGGGGLAYTLEEAVAEVGRLRAEHMPARIVRVLNDGAREVVDEAILSGAPAEAGR